MDNYFLQVALDFPFLCICLYLFLIMTLLCFGSFTCGKALKQRCTVAFLFHMAVQHICFQDKMGTVSFWQ